MVYVVPPLLLVVGVPATAAWGTGLAVGVTSAWALYKHPEWYVIDTVGILVAAGAAAIFGISLGIVPVVVLLAALAAYDAIAVYKTKHMLALADSVMELRLPVLLVIPKTRHYHFLDEVSRFKQAADKDEAEERGERDALFMGLGDLVMPTILVVSALVFGAGWGTAPAWGAALGTLWGYLVLMSFVLRGRPQAGLPLLNGGAIAGFLTGLYAATGSIVFW
jgi:presenilin-like A22 family membrane protease